VNSRKTQNLQTLIVRILGVVSSSEDAEQRLTAANGVCFLKFVLKSLLEKLSGPDFLTFLDGYHVPGNHLRDQKPDPNGLLTKLVKSLLNVVLDGVVTGEGYLLVTEAVQCLLVGCSTQLYVEYVTWSVGTHPVLEVLMDKEGTAGTVIQNLIEWYIQRLAPPPGVKIFREAPEGNPSVFKFVRKAAVSVLWLPMTAFKYLVGSGNDQGFSPLADAAQHLLMVLVHHVPHKTSDNNPYRNALESLRDMTYVGGVESDMSPHKEHNIPCASFADLYKQLSRSQSSECGTLMLYTMVQCIQSFRDYALVRSDVETLLLPVLKQVYQVSMGSQSQLYLLSIILLILSQDASFAQDIHKIIISGPEWYKERPLGKLSLGSFMIVLLLRMAHANLGSARDLYLHTNTMAALANITGTAVKMDAFAAQRYLGLVDLLSRKYRKSLTGEATPTGRDLEFRLQFFNDFLQMMLEVLNGVITPRPANNPNLVYAILQRQSLFDDIATISPEYTELVESIQLLLNYFNTEIDKAKETDPNAAWTVQQVLQVVQSAAPSWRSGNLRSVPELRFTYEEEQSAEQFFVPVVWTLVVSFSGLPWNTDSISLFTPQTPTASALGSEDFHHDLPHSVSNGTEV